jgi:multicomponent Na+:H+ antiporter subunit G
VTVLDTIGNVLMLAGAAIAILAGVGLVRFSTPYARFHAAGKASPVAFLLTALGAGLRLGPNGSPILAVAVAAMLLTLPFGIHLLYRAVHRSNPGRYVGVDELETAEQHSIRDSHGSGH